MQVDHTVVGVELVLLLDPLPEGPDVVAEVGVAGGLDAREDAGHVGQSSLIGSPSRTRSCYLPGRPHARLEGRRRAPRSDRLGGVADRHRLVSEWEAQLEAGAAGGVAGIDGAELAAVGVGELASHGEAVAQPLVGRVEVAVELRLLEPWQLEDALALLGGDLDALVLDGEDHLIALADRAELDGGLRGGVAVGVQDEIAENVEDLV